MAPGHSCNCASAIEEILNDMGKKTAPNHSKPQIQFLAFTVHDAPLQAHWHRGIVVKRLMLIQDTFGHKTPNKLVSSNGQMD